MVRAIRIPVLLDILLVDEAATIRALADDPRLDRTFPNRGPLLNRIISGRIRRTLQIDGVPLPPVAARAAAAPAAERDALAARLDALPPDRGCAEPHLQALAAHVRGQSNAPALGPLVQEVLGRNFLPDFRADVASWRAAQLIDAGVRSNNPLRHLLWAVTGQLRRAQRLLADRAGGDPAITHTTGVAVHNLVIAFQRMQLLFGDGNNPGRISTSRAVAHCLSAPGRVLRHATVGGSIADTSFRTNTLIVFQLEAAHRQTLRQDIAFMAGSWSSCPANTWVPRLLGAVWDRAVRDHQSQRQAP